MVNEATGKSTGELVALSKQWTASHNNTNTASKLTLDKLQLICIFCSFQSREFSLIRWEETMFVSCHFVIIAMNLASLHEVSAH